VLKKIGLNIGRKKGGEKKISENKADHEDAVDPIDSESSDIDEDAEEDEKRKGSHPSGGCVAGDVMEGLEKEGGTARDVSGCERVKKEKISDPGESFAWQSKTAARHGNEVDFTGKSEINVEENQRSAKEKKPADGEKDK
jgi:hypothetical protein